RESGLRAWISDLELGSILELGSDLELGLILKLGSGLESELDLWSRVKIRSRSSIGWGIVSLVETEGWGSISGPKSRVPSKGQVLVKTEGLGLDLKFRGCVGVGPRSQVRVRSRIVIGSKLDWAGIKVGRRTQRLEPLWMVGEGWLEQRVGLEWGG
ncbi:hypothetical protein HAX54_042053, partial [Datura stramonium]|nr:hypothetical protein [Datura stramonium]